MVFTIVSFAFKKTRAKRVHSAFGGFGACPLNKITVGIYHGSEKVPSVYPCLFLFKPLISFPPFAEIAPRLSLLSQKFEQSENIGQFS